MTTTTPKGPAGKIKTTKSKTTTPTTPKSLSKKAEGVAASSKSAKASPKPTGTKAASRKPTAGVSATEPDQEMIVMPDWTTNHPCLLHGGTAKNARLATRVAVTSFVMPATIAQFDLSTSVANVAMRATTSGEDDVAGAGPLEVVYRPQPQPSLRFYAYQPDHIRARKPALWRTVLEPALSPLQEQRQHSFLPIVLDCVGADLVPNQHMTNDDSAEAMMAIPHFLTSVPSVTATNIVRDRLQSVIASTIWPRYLPRLLLHAALEEVQAAYFRQQQQQMPLAGECNGDNSQQASSQAMASQHQQPPTHKRDGSAPPYYRQSPTVYLIPPTPPPKKGSITSSNAGVGGAIMSITTTTTTPERILVHNIPSVHVTPSQLLGRIKQGCALVYSSYNYEMQQRQHQEQQQLQHGSSAFFKEQPTSSTTTTISGLAAGRRGARRRAGTTGGSQSGATSVSQPTGDPTALWKAVPGGKVAGFLNTEFLMAKETTTTAEFTDTLMDDHDDSKRESKRGEDGQQQYQGPADCETDSVKDGDAGHPQNPSPSSEKEEDKFGGNSSKVEVDDATPSKKKKKDTAKSKTPQTKLAAPDMPVEKDLEMEGTNGEAMKAHNPYLLPNGACYVEWLGLKGVKILSLDEIQEYFAHVLFVPKPKKKRSKPKNDPSADTPFERSPFELGHGVSALLSRTDRVILEHFLPEATFLLGSSARLVLQVADHVDAPSLDEWDTSSFGRSPFRLAVLNSADVQEELQLKAYVEYAEAELHFKERKAWETWRYKGIHGGHTIWPTWTSAVERWIESLKLTAGDGNGEADKSDLVREAHTAGSDSSDLEVAKKIAEQEVEVPAGRRKTRRAAEGGSAGIFYGNQSNMTQKQIMDALLRLISQKSFYTSMGLMSAVPDESSDPFRRIRICLGRLLWKRNQIARRFVNSEWTDRPLWDTLQERPLLVISNEELGESRTDNDNLKERPQRDMEGAEGLVRYIKMLHQTELQLRELVVHRLGEIPIGMIATAADERPGSMEAMDQVDFEDLSAVEWFSSGHELIGKDIYRPPALYDYSDIPTCKWYRLADYSHSVPVDAEAVDVVAERSSIGNAKEIPLVQRRIRFRAVPVDEQSSNNSGNVLILTEAQASAGVKAANMVNRERSLSKLPDNPFVGAPSSQISLASISAPDSQPITGHVVGHDVSTTNDDQFDRRILILPSGSDDAEAFWATLDFQLNGMIHCRIAGDDDEYSIHQFDYHSRSPAFRECRNIVQYLGRHPKSGPFMEPVDPVGLNIPEYPTIVKNPMDISTLSSKLENGEYSSIPPTMARGHSAISRMLNGPFRNDVELIFDNAMLFNPSDDWIHQAAHTLKKAVIKKIEQVSLMAEDQFGVSAPQARSVYTEYDSDVDMHANYESDEYEGDEGQRGHKRKRSVKQAMKDDASSRAIEHPIRLQKILSDYSGLRGPFAQLPVRTDASVFTLPSDWRCRHRRIDEVEADGESKPSDKVEAELKDMMLLFRGLEETETSNRRRSTRTHWPDSEPKKSVGTKSDAAFYCPGLIDEATHVPRNRFQVEVAVENLHEDYYARLYQKFSKSLKPLDEASESERAMFGLFTDGSFPPYLGRVVAGQPPSLSCPFGSGQSQGAFWEIREPFIIPALRWVVRGLIASQHLSALEPIDMPSGASGSGGIVVPNHVYYVDPTLNPFEVLDLREAVRRKKGNTNNDESSEDEVEMSEYEKLRAERVARNAERLRALGLA